MDKEAQEKIGELPRNPYESKTIKLDRAVHMGRFVGYDQAQQDMLKAGYRKLPKDKPPSLSNGEIARAMEITPKYNNYHMLGTWKVGDEHIAIAQAQREADIKFYS